MGGLAVLLIVTLYLVAAIFVVRAAPGQRAKIIATIIVILIPTADAILGRLYLKYLCETQGGAKVYRVVENVEGFRWDGAIAMNESDEGSKRFVGRFGLRFIESRVRPDGKVDRISLRGDQVIRERAVVPKSMYALDFVSSDYGLLSLYIRDRNIVETVQGKDLIAVDTQFIFKGGWVEHLFASFSDAGPGSAAWCEVAYPEVRRENLIKQSLKLTSVKDK